MTDTLTAPPASNALTIPEPMRVRGVSDATLKLQSEMKRDLEAALPQLMAVVPKGVSAVALASAAFACTQDNPALLECEPLSLIRSVYKMAVLNLMIGQTCDLVPTKTGYGNRERKLAECWIRVKGVVQLAIRSGAVQWATVGYICEGDDWSEDADGKVLHKRKGTPAQDASNVTHVYARITLRSGEKVYELWTRERILAHRDRYAKNLEYEGKPNQKSPWIKDPLPMWGKTVVKSALRFAPLSAEILSAINAGDGEVVGDFEVVSTTIDPTEALRAGAGVLSLGTGVERNLSDAMTLSQAERVPLPGPPESWGGKGGQPLGALKPALLQRFIAWVDETGERQKMYEQQREAAQIIIDDKSDSDESAALRSKSAGFPT